LSANNPQTLRDEYSRATKFTGTDCKQSSASFDDVIKTCENLHVEEQHQLKVSCLSLSKIWNILRQPYYLDDLLILTNSSFKDHPLKLEMVLTRISTTVMRVNISKSKFFAEQIEFLKYWIIGQRIQPISNKFKEILKFKASKQEKKHKLANLLM
jgi:hypothetical protein